MFDFRFEQTQRCYHNHACKLFKGRSKWVEALSCVSNLHCDLEPGSCVSVIMAPPFFSTEQEFRFFRVDEFVILFFFAAYLAKFLYLCFILGTSHQFAHDLARLLVKFDGAMGLSLCGIMSRLWRVHDVFPIVIRGGSMLMVVATNWRCGVSGCKKYCKNTAHAINIHKICIGRT